jgi:hypothetical protein
MFSRARASLQVFPFVPSLPLRFLLGAFIPMFMCSFWLFSMGGRSTPVQPILETASQFSHALDPSSRSRATLLYFRPCFLLNTYQSFSAPAQTVCKQRAPDSSQVLHSSFPCHCCASTNESVQPRMAGRDRRTLAREALPGRGGRHRRGVGCGSGRGRRQR